MVVENTAWLSSLVLHHNSPAGSESVMQPDLVRPRNMKGNWHCWPDTVRQVSSSSSSSSPASSLTSSPKVMTSWPRLVATKPRKIAGNIISLVWPGLVCSDVQLPEFPELQHR